MKYNVLYIDDEEANLQVFNSAFRRDYNIYTALSGEEGLQIVEEEAKKKYFLYMFISKPWEPDELKDILDEAIFNAFETNS